LSLWVGMLMMVLLLLILGFGRVEIKQYHDNTKGAQNQRPFFYYKLNAYQSNMSPVDIGLFSRHYIPNNSTSLSG
ncbi:MAG: hypothetical protein FWC92_09465, partial [Defluviitaleaceae bacterium]|nr:hypothetical protein [Defluviitaleaceae bacterium]